MNLNGLQTFLAILETGSLVGASKRLNVTQSTVTARLKVLEEGLGQTLLIREKSGVTLTASGLRLKRYAETMTELWRQARQETALPDAVSTVCNIGCHPDLWPGLGKRLFVRIREERPEVGLSIWHAGDKELADWLDSGLTDVSLGYRSAARGRQSAYALPPDALVLVSTRPNASPRFDPGYVFVEAGEDFGRAHAVAYADASTARLSFGSAVLGLEHLMEQGGSAYLPERIAAPLLAEGRLYRVAEAPDFQRSAYLTVNDRAVAEWPWFESLRLALGATTGTTDGARAIEKSSEGSHP